MAEFQDQKSGDSPEHPERKIFEVEGDIWDYDRIAKTLSLVGRAFFDRFYPTSYSEDEKAKLLTQFTRSVSKEHPIAHNTASLPGHYLRGDFPVVLEFNETYFPMGKVGYFEYDEDSKLVPQDKEPLVDNDCYIRIYARAGMSEDLRKLHGKFPESAAKFRQDVVNFAEEIPTLMNGITLSPHEDPIDTLWQGSLATLKEKYPFDVPTNRTLHLDPKLFKKGRGKVKIAVYPVATPDQNLNKT